MPQQFTYEHGGGYAPGYGGGQHPDQQHQQPHQHYQQGDHHQGQHGTHQQQNNYDVEIQQAVKVGTKILPKILKKLGCCTIM